MYPLLDINVVGIDHRVANRRKVRKQVGVNRSDTSPKRTVQVTTHVNYQIYAL